MKIVGGYLLTLIIVALSISLTTLLKFAEIDTAIYCSALTTLILIVPSLLIMITYEILGKSKRFNLTVFKRTLTMLLILCLCFTTILGLQ